MKYYLVQLIIESKKVQESRNVTQLHYPKDQKISNNIQVRFKICEI